MRAHNIEMLIGICFVDFEANFGPRLMSKQCVDIIAKYLTDNKISGDISINFAPGLTCSGRIISYNKTKNNPESRKFAVWINDVKIYFINLFKFFK